MEPVVRVGSQIVIPSRELAWRFSRSSGPGGQGVNTTDSRVELVFDLAHSPTLPPRLRARALERLGARAVQGTIVVVASETRSQTENRKRAIARLSELLTRAVAPPPRRRKPTRPSRAANERRLQAKKARGAQKRLRRSTSDG